MVRNLIRSWQAPDGRQPSLARRAAVLAAGLAVVTGLDLLLHGRPQPLSYVVVAVVWVAIGRLFRGLDQGAEGTGRWRPPPRLPRGRARLVIGLGVAALALGVAGALVTRDLAGAASGGGLVAAGLGNLAWGIGSLLPEGRRARALRLATLPLSVAMFLAFAAWVAMESSARF